MNTFATALVAWTDANATLPYTQIRVMTGREFVKNATTTGRRPTIEAQTLLQWFAAWGERDVIVAEQHLVKPGLNGMTKAEFLRNRGLYDERIGTLLGATMPKTRGMTTAMAVNVFLNSVDQCSTVILSIVKAMALHPSEQHFVTAIFEDGQARNIPVACAVPLHRTLFYTAAMTIDPTTQDELSETNGATPIIVTRKWLHDEHGQIAAQDALQSLPQVNCTKKNGVCTAPNHWIMIFGCVKNGELFAVVFDPTFGQYNPEAVIKGCQSIRLQMPDYRAIYTGSPKAFSVGDVDLDVPVYDQIVAWIQKSSDLQLKGVSLGKIGDYFIVDKSYYL